MAAPAPPRAYLRKQENTASAPQKHPQDGQQHRRDDRYQYRTGYGYVEAKVLALYHDVSGQATKADLAQKAPEQADDDQDDSRGDKNSGHDRRMAPGFPAINGRVSGLLVINGCAKPAMS